MAHFDFWRGCFDGVFGATLTLKRAKSDRLLAAWLEKLIHYLANFAALGLVALCFFDRFGNAFDLCVVWLFISLFAGLIIMKVVRSETGLLSRILASPPLVYLGKVSYGLYLWHFPICLLVQSHHWPLLREVAVEIPLSAAATLASFYLLERPLLRLKRRFQPVATARI